MTKDIFKTGKVGQEGLVTAEELKRRLKEGEDLFLLDIRKEDDYEEGTIDGAHHSEWEAVADMLQEDSLPRDKDIIVFCYNGQSSMQIAMVLNIQGYSAYSLLDGIEGWKECNQ